MHLRVALTGGIASGKSFVAGVLTDLGAVVIDADVLAREAVRPGSPGLGAIVERFGDEVLTAEGVLDRARLAGVVFTDDAARADLNAIVHPRVRELAGAAEAAAPPGSVVVHVIPLLVETGQAGDFDGVLVVDVPVAVQLERLRQRDGMSEADAAARVSAQATREERLAAATWVIDNDGTPEATRDRVRTWWDGPLSDLRRQRVTTCSPRSSGAVPS